MTKFGVIIKKKKPKQHSESNKSEQAIASLGFVGVVFLLLILAVLDVQLPEFGFSSGGEFHDNALAISSTDVSEFAQLFKTALDYQQNNKPALALNVYDKAYSLLATDQTKPERKTLAFFYYKKAQLHWNLWQFVEAKQSWINSLNYLKNRELVDYVNYYLAETKEILDAENKERNLHTVYDASPNRGPAGYLGGHIAIVFFYIKDESGSTWGVKQRLIAENALGNVKQWYASQSAGYQKGATFSMRKYIIDRDPYIRRVNLGYKKERRVDRLVVERSMKNIGHKSVRDFIVKIKHEERADQVAMVFLTNRKSRSFALRCLRYCTSGGGEFAFVLVDANTKNSSNMEYAQAHELLHLFGADDLYSIKDAKNYAVRDIMNSRSRYLNVMKIEPITAFAVGLTDKLPETPFTVNTH